jgi:hypothetical protein
MEVTEEDRKAAEAKTYNPFDELIKGFENRHNETITLMKEIHKTLMEIEKNKIQIGPIMEHTNTGENVDGKFTNFTQNISLSNNIDMEGIFTRMDDANKKLEGILTNTSITDNGDQKINAVWSI